MAGQIGNEEVSRTKPGSRTMCRRVSASESGGSLLTSRKMEDMVVTDVDLFDDMEKLT